MSYLMRGLSLLFVLSFPLLLVTTNAALAVNQVRLYQYDFDRYRISEITGIERSELMKAARGLIRYFNSSQSTAQTVVVKQGKEIELFNEREVTHLADVKSLIHLVYRSWLGAFLYAVSYLALGFGIWRQRFWSELKRATIGGSLLTLGTIGALGLASVLSFNQVFLQFHLLSFSNPFWQLDPTKDYLIMMFPEGFFRDATLFIAAATAAEALLLGATVGCYELRHRKRQKEVTTGDSLPPGSEATGF